MSNNKSSKHTSEYDLRTLFKKEGVEPVNPTDPVWDSICHYMQSYVIDNQPPEKHDMHEWLRIWKQEPSNEKRGLGREDTAIAVTYIKWCQLYREALRSNLLEDNNLYAPLLNSVCNQPEVIEALRQYLIALTPSQVAGLGSTLQLVRSHTELGRNVEQHLNTMVISLLQNPSPPNITNVVSIYPYLSMDVPIPLTLTATFTDALIKYWAFSKEDPDGLEEEFRWLHMVAHIEPLLAAQLEVDFYEDSIHEMLWASLPRIPFEKPNLNTQWLYIVLTDVRATHLKDDKYKQLRELITESISKIPTKLRTQWDAHRKYVDALGDNALSKAILLSDPLTKTETLQLPSEWLHTENIQTMSQET